MTRGQFAYHVLKGIGAPNTLHNRRALQAQMQSEGGSARWNPFNTTQEMVGATDYNWVGVKNYVSAEQGIAATVKTLQYRDYRRVRHALIANYPARKTVRLIGESPWGTGGGLLREVFQWIARVSWVLRWLERKPVAS